MSKASIAIVALSITVLVLGVGLVIALSPEAPTPVCYTEKEDQTHPITPGYSYWEQFNISFIKVGLVSVDFSAKAECTSGVSDYVSVALIMDGSQIWNVQVDDGMGLTPVNCSLQFPALAAGLHYVALRLYGDSDGYIQNTTLSICLTAS